MYRNNDIIKIEFEDGFDFCQFLFVIIDLLETTREDSRDVIGFVNTDRPNKITEYLNGESVCLYLSETLKQVLKEDEDSYLNVIDIVTASNKNYSINIENFFSFNLEDTRKYEASKFNLLEYQLIAEGTYLFKEEDFESEFLENLENIKGLDSQVVN